MNVRKLLLMLLCMGIPILVFSQTDSTKKKVPLFKKPINTTRLELTYRAVEYHSARYGTTVAYIPGVIINDARPVRIDRHGNILRRYYTKAPLANEQLDLMNQQRRRGTYQMVLGLVGVVSGYGVDKAVDVTIKKGAWQLTSPEKYCSKYRVT
ncbi:hypothetical protein [Chitinophaga ginsengisoli]|uniref:GLPGLI family protein n=1 Tax=Chitinophaga ginsengisoli TaxID=363837 RepID=A0A2P8GLB4_9BACT|nr:hypothetical protein [Chitinophaga ginsengisoli]PSL34767.1 hypothetical protein CLV42_102340 [Chitinophaga ginsengisoli]